MALSFGAEFPIIWLKRAKKVELVLIQKPCPAVALDSGLPVAATGEYHPTEYAPAGVKSDGPQPGLSGNSSYAAAEMLQPMDGK